MAKSASRPLQRLPGCKKSTARNTRIGQSARDDATAASVEHDGAQRHGKQQQPVGSALTSMHTHPPLDLFISRSLRSMVVKFPVLYSTLES